MLLQLRHTWKMDIPLLVAADDQRRLIIEKWQVPSIRTTLVAKSICYKADVAPRTFHLSRDIKIYNVIGHLQNQDTSRTNFPPRTPPRQLQMHLTTQKRIYCSCNLYQPICYLQGQVLAVCSVELQALHLGGARFRAVGTIASAVVSAPP